LLLACTQFPSIFVVIILTLICRISPDILYTTAV
jgi:hypothetical protein